MFKTKKMRIVTISITLLLALCVTVLAKTGSQWIEIFYSDIKINVNGTRINTSNNEPFIYNGTTYLPVRAVAEALGQNVDWDGNTKTVSIGSKPSGAAYLMDVCPPYSGYIDTKTFQMAGKSYSKGFVMGGDCTVLVNLDAKYTQLNCTVGHPDNTNGMDNDLTIRFYVDQKLVKEFELYGGELPEQISIPLNYGLQLKIETNNDRITGIGIANITVE